MCLAAPGKIISRDKYGAVVDFGGVRRKVSLGVIEGARVGDHVLVHAGFVIGRISGEEAADARKSLEQLREVVREDIVSRSAGRREDAGG